jgi:hypothetical protein
VRRIVPLVLLALFWPLAARAQGVRESWTLGVTGAAGYPPVLGAVRFGAALGPKAGVDLIVGRFAGSHGDGVGDGFGRVAGAQFRWMRGGRQASGDSRYWIFGALATRGRFTTTVGYTGGGIIGRFVSERTYVAPRIGYGVDHLARCGARIGAEFTTGAAAEEVPFIFGGLFVMWGPPRR